MTHDGQLAAAQLALDQAKAREASARAALMAAQADLGRVQAAKEAVLPLLSADLRRMTSAQRKQAYRDFERIFVERQLGRYPSMWTRIRRVLASLNLFGTRGDEAHLLSSAVNAARLRAALEGAHGRTGTPVDMEELRATIDACPPFYPPPLKGSTRYTR
jgi:hypothetical protein